MASKLEAVKARFLAVEGEITFREITLEEALPIFEHTKDINDTNDISELDMRYVLGAVEQGKLQGLIYVYYKPSLDAHGFSVYLAPDTGFRYVKVLDQLLARVSREVVDTIWFDTAMSCIYDWVKESWPELKLYWIYDRYGICYAQKS